jgi:transcriptional regulator with XRE-family HTH domain
MSVRQGPIDLGREDARRVNSSIASELRDTRVALGLSQGAVATGAGISASRLGRIERGEVRDPSFAAICRVARVLGLTVSVKLYPSGSPLRDAPQLRLMARFETLVAHPLRLRREVLLPGDDEQRAWDAMIIADDGFGFAEGESRIGDAQALVRRMERKLRDDPRGSTIILVVARTRHNRRVLQEHREAFRSLLPLDGAAIARSLRAGRLPPAGGIIVL